MVKQIRNWRTRFHIFLKKTVEKLATHKLQICHVISCPAQSSPMKKSYEKARFEECLDQVFNKHFKSDSRCNFVSVQSSPVIWSQIWNCAATALILSPIPNLMNSHPAPKPLFPAPWLSPIPNLMNEHPGPNPHDNHSHIVSETSKYVQEEAASDDT